MKNHVVTKETAILLRDAGFPQTTEWYWVWDAFQNDNLLKQYFSAYVTGKVDQKYPKNEKWISAPIAEEIIKELGNVGMHRNDLQIGFDETIWYIKDKKNPNLLVESMKLSEALAKLYIKKAKKKNNLI